MRKQYTPAITKNLHRFALVNKALTKYTCRSIHKPRPVLGLVLMKFIANQKESTPLNIA